MNRETLDEMMSFATSLLVAFWLIQLTSYIWDVFVIVCKTLLTKAVIGE